MKQFLLAFQFLTIIPVKIKDSISEKDIAESSIFFPLIGAIKGLVIAFAASILINIFSPAISGGLVILILLIMNGGFHIDGLADTFDAIAVKSSGNTSKDKDKRLSVMKDSFTGSIGVSSIVMAILLKYLFINNLLNFYPLLTATFIIFLMPVFSGWSMIPAMYHGMPSRNKGLGYTFITYTTIKTVFISSLLLFIIIVLTVLALPLKSSIGELGPSVLIFILLYLLSFIAVKFLQKRFGGLSGDNLGAISEISEIIFLMIVTILLQF